MVIRYIPSKKEEGKVRKGQMHQRRESHGPGSSCRVIYYIPSSNLLLCGY